MAKEIPLNDPSVPYSIIVSSFFHFELCRRLVKNGLLTPDDAARIFNGTANKIRDALSDVEFGQKSESIASAYERYSDAILVADGLSIPKSKN